MAVLSPIEGGPYSHMTVRTFAVVTNDHDFDALYRRIHAGRLPPRTVPEVDFEGHIVVAVFTGRRSTAGHGIALQGVATTAESVVTVGFAETGPAADTVQAAVLTAPYAIAALPRGNYAVVRFVDADGDEVTRIPLDASSSTSR